MGACGDDGQAGQCGFAGCSVRQAWHERVIAILTGNDATVPQECSFTLEDELNLEEKKQADQEVLHEIPRAPEDEMENAQEAEVQI